MPKWMVVYDIYTHLSITQMLVVERFLTRKKLCYTLTSLNKESTCQWHFVNGDFSLAMIYHRNCPQAFKKPTQCEFRSWSHVHLFLPLYKIVPSATHLHGKACLTSKIQVPNNFAKSILVFLEKKITGMAEEKTANTFMVMRCQVLIFFVKTRFLNFPFFECSKMIFYLKKNPRTQNKCNFLARNTCTQVARSFILMFKP